METTATNIQDDLTSMMNALDGTAVVEEKPDAKEEEKGEKEKEEVKPKEEEPVLTEEKKEESPKVEVKKEEPVVDPRDKAISDLRAELEVLKAKTTPAAEKKEEKPPEITIGEQDFVKDVDIDELTRDPKELNKLLNNVYKQASIDTQNALISKLPDMVNKNMTVMQSLQQTRENFYNENQDLKPFENVVKVVFEEFIAKDPNKSLADHLKEVGPEVRKRLNISKPSEKKKEEPSPKLPTVSGRSGRASEGKSNAVQDEIDEMSKVLEA